MPLDKVKVRVPATAANLGPGFDCLGLALDIYNTIAVEKSDSFGVFISGEGSESLPHSCDNRVYQTMVTFYRKVGKPVPGLQIACHNDIPLRRGLGGSAAAIVGALVAANLLCGQPLSDQELVNLGATLEGHPDNVAPALLGGCQAVTWDGDCVVSAQVPLPPGLKAILFIPDFEMATEESRRVLPHKVSRADAVFNLGRVALLVSALASGELRHLRLATQDRLHQPARQALFPAMGQIFEAALEAGALAAFLSGGGPTILSLTQEGEAAIAEAMLQAAGKAGVSGQTKVARPSLVGAHRVD